MLAWNGGSALCWWSCGPRRSIVSEPPRGGPAGVPVAAARHLVLRPLVQDHELVRRLVHADRREPKASRVPGAALVVRAVAVLLRSLGAELHPAGDTIRH